MYSLLKGLFKQIPDLEIILLGRDEIQVGGMDEHNGYVGILAEVVHIALLNVVQIFCCYILLIFTTSPGDVLQQTFRFVVQIDDEVRFGKKRGDGVENGAVQVEFVPKQIVFGEDDTLVDEIVAHHKVFEHIAGGQQLAQLTVTLHEEVHLHGQRIVDRVLVELGQERVVGELFHHQLGVAVFGQHLGEGGLAGSNATLNHNIVIWYRHDSKH